MTKAPASTRVDQINIGLIVLSLILAIYFPYRGFLVAYAVLGPLHYLTELNWLHGRDYFVKERRWIWVAVIAGLLIALPKLAHPNYPTSSWFPESVQQAILSFNAYTSGFIFVGLLLAIAMVFVRSWKARGIVLGLGIVLAILINGLPFYALLVGLLIPTLIHVYLFTLLFMFFGARKGKSFWGYIAVAAAIAVPVFIAFFDPTNMHYVFPEVVKQMFEASGFHGVNAQFGKSLNLTDGTRFSFYERLFLRLQIFITFAYIYHYLNWFSKTTIIGWHKTLTKGRTLAMAVVWIVIVAAFAIDYKLGLLVGLSLSFMHVLGEFPLNVVTIRSLFGKR